MYEFVQNLKADLGEAWKQVKGGVLQLMGKAPDGSGSVVSTKTANTYEINLVPVVKAEMIKAQKIRNLVLFICIVVSAVAVGVVLVLFGIKSGQDIAMASQDNKITRLSQIMGSYGELDDLVTIQSQLTKYDEIVKKKTSLTRVFGALAVMRPSGEDEVKMSQLRVNLETNVVNIEGQADAKAAPLIDYRVLESFKKSVDLTKFDYGRYVDLDGKEIPTQCMIEADENGSPLREGDSYYAWWDLTIEGCQAQTRNLSWESGEAQFHYSADAEVEIGVPGHTVEAYEECDRRGQNCVTKYRVTDVTPPEEGEESTVTSEDLTPRPLKVKVWRTPRFDEWYKTGNLALNGTVKGLEHFDSQCFQYKGTETLTGVRWSSTNDCLLAPNGLKISSSSNGRDASDNLVLKFAASVTFAEEFFSFNNKHVIAIGPMGQNVTDSYVQIGGMFTQAARACEADDTECLANTGNSGGGQ